MFMNKRSNKTGFINRPAAGFSLVEIMVALVISLFVLGGAITILVQNQENYRRNDDFGRLQENARFALDLITSDLRMAGFLGCSALNITNQVPGVDPGSLLDTTFSLDGSEQNTEVWSAQGSAEITDQILQDTDAITVRKLRNAGVPISASIAPNAAIPVQASPVAEGELAAIYNCDATHIFQATGVTNTSIGHATAFTIAYAQNAAHTASPGDDVDGLLAQTFVAPVDAVRYYIAENDEGEPSLWRQFHNGAEVDQQPVVEGVENMQILYGENTDASGDPSVFVTADNVTDWNRVVAVKLTLLIRTIDEYGQEDDSKKYDIYGTPDDDSDDITPGGHYSRKLVSATVMLRNMQTKLGSGI